MYERTSRFMNPRYERGAKQIPTMLSFTNFSFLDQFHFSINARE